MILNPASHVCILIKKEKQTRTHIQRLSMFRLESNKCRRGAPITCERCRRTHVMFRQQPLQTTRPAATTAALPSGTTTTEWYYRSTTEWYYNYQVVLQQYSWVDKIPCIGQSFTSTKLLTDLEPEVYSEPREGSVILIPFKSAISVIWQVTFPLQFSTKLFFFFLFFHAFLQLANQGGCFGNYISQLAVAVHHLHQHIAPKTAIKLKCHFLAAIALWIGGVIREVNHSQVSTRQRLI